MIDSETQFDNDIIIIGQQPWDTEIGSNCKNIALEFSKTNRVLYVNSPLDRITSIKYKDDPKVQYRLNVIGKKAEGLVKIKDNLWTYYPDCMVESINWIGSDSVFNLLNKINNQRSAKSIKKAIDALSFTNFILFNDSEIYKGFYLKKFLKPQLSIYYSRDYMIGVDYWKKHGEKLEPLLIKDAELCFANSPYLEEYCRRYNLNSFDAGQGCDLELFQNSDYQLPDDLKATKRPIIGYVGVLSSDRLDIEIISHIATSFPHAAVVLVGPEDEVFTASELHQIDNIIFLGLKPVNLLPNYISGFDVCINPQLVNALTIGNYPRKIDEYLALGKPVVATSTKTMTLFKDYVYLADTREDYVTEIKKAFNEDNPLLSSPRKDFAFLHTWENSVKLMSAKINLELNKRTSST